MFTTKVADLQSAVVATGHTIPKIEAKSESIRATRSSDETYMKALDAIRRYTGAVDDDTEEL